MCGIAGIVSGVPDRVDEARLVRMRDTMTHRGPDASGVWHDEARRVGLAHRRLSIIDLSPAGAQPMATADGELQLVYNGEIYNHVELRGELESAGHRFRGRSDTEVLLHGYREWGEGLLDRLQGMFAFAIWDRERERLFIARDRIGIKPVYFSNEAGQFLFASEIKAILADPAISRELDPVSAWHYLTFFVPPAPLTMFRSIYKLPAGHKMIVHPGKEPELSRWWDPSDEPLDLPDDDTACAEQLLELLDRSIERRMMSDVPFGVFLSGGVDSSTNVALMSRHMSRPVTTFSVGFKEHEQYNELDYARKVSRRFGTDHHEVLIDENDMLDYLPQMVHHQDEPIADWVCVPLHFVSKLARDQGVTVVQVGEGADELLCGYDHFRIPLDQERRYGRPLRALPGPFRSGVAGLFRAAGRFGDRWQRRADLVSRIADGEEIFWGGAICWRGEMKERIWGASRNGRPPNAALVPEAYTDYDSGAVVREILSPFRRENQRADFYQNMLYLELRFRLPELLLMRVDKIAMSSSVEARVPFLDHELVQFCMNVPMRMRLRGGVGKYLLKKAVRGLLPDEVIDRTKMGFGAPMREWLCGPFGRFARDRLLNNRHGLFDSGTMQSLFDEHVAGQANWSAHIWTLLNLTLWHEHWIERRPV